MIQASFDDNNVSTLEQAKKDGETVSDSEDENEVSATKSLLVDIGSGRHIWTQRPRILFISNEYNLSGEPMIKLSMNRDDYSNKFDIVRLNMTQWRRLCVNDATSFHQFVHSNKMKQSLHSNIGYGVYESYDPIHDEIYIGKMYLPYDKAITVDFSKKSNCDDIYKYLMHTAQGLIINKNEYKQLRKFFNTNIMRTYIPLIDTFSAKCKSCANMPYVRKKSCMFCRYFTFNLEA